MITTTIQTKKITEKTAAIVDITAKLRDAIQERNIRQGLLAAFVAGSTAALTTIEHEPGLIQDRKELIERLIPSNRCYYHDDRWGDDNGFSQMRASLFDPSIAIPIENGQTLFGNLATSCFARLRQSLTET